MKAPFRVRVRASSRRGFTLIELLISVAIAMLAIGLAMSSFISFQRGMQAQEVLRSASASTRDATIQIEASLRHAGWGVHPAAAIDVWEDCPNADGTPTCGRDSSTGSDTLAFVARNPNYRWRADGDLGEDPADPADDCTETGGCFEGNAWRTVSINVGGTPPTITIEDLPATTVLRAGQRILALCPGGSEPIILTLAADTTGGGPGTTTELTPEDVSRWPYNDHVTLAGSACHQNVGAGVFLVDSYRYYVDTFENTPWLMLDRNFGAPVPIARNVEDLQLAYVLNLNTGAGPDNDTDWILGNNPASGVEEPRRDALRPEYATTTNDPARFNRHPGNVRAVRLTLTLRSARTDQRFGPGGGEPLPVAENRPEQARTDGYRRFTARSEVTLRNLDSRSPFIF